MAFSGAGFRRLISERPVYFFLGRAFCGEMPLGDKIDAVAATGFFAAFGFFASRLPRLGLLAIHASRTVGREGTARGPGMPGAFRLRHRRGCDQA